MLLSTYGKYLLTDRNILFVGCRSGLVLRKQLYTSIMAVQHCHFILWRNIMQKTYDLNPDQIKIFSSLIKKYVFPFFFLASNEKIPVRSQQKESLNKGKLGATLHDKYLTTALKCEPGEFVIINPFTSSSNEAPYSPFNYFFYFKNIYYCKPSPSQPNPPSSQLPLKKAKIPLEAITKAFMVYMDNPSIELYELHGLCESFIDSIMLKTIFKNHIRLDTALITRLLTQIKEVANKTNEGSKIELSFILNTSCKNQAIKQYLKFLEHNQAGIVLTNAKDCCIYFTDNSYCLKNLNTDNDEVSKTDIDKNAQTLSEDKNTQTLSEDKNAIPRQEKHSDYAPLIPMQFENFMPYCNKDHVCIILTKHNDILLLDKNGLSYAYRSGQWNVFQFSSFRNVFSLKPAFTKLSTDGDADNETIKENIKHLYQAVLDTAFSRRGGGIVICTKEAAIQMIKNKNIFETDVVNPDYVDEIDGKRAHVFNKLIGNKIFSTLPSELRTELINIDGSVIITFDGTIIAIGSILQNLESSAGGARTSAMKGISKKYKKCIAIKISEDGYIVTYRSGKSHYRIG